jgi:hypothetical protein
MTDLVSQLAGILLGRQMVLATYEQAAKPVLRNLLALIQERCTKTVIQPLSVTRSPLLEGDFGNLIIQVRRLVTTHGESVLVEVLESERGARVLLWVAEYGKAPDAYWMLNSIQEALVQQYLHTLRILMDAFESVDPRGVMATIRSYEPAWPNDLGPDRELWLRINVDNLSYYLGI